MICSTLHISKFIVPTKKPILVKWFLPPSGTLKLNIDGASKDNPKLTGCGGVLRPNNCSIIDNFSCLLSMETSTVAQLSTFESWFNFVLST